MSPQEKAVWMMSIYNAQYDDYLLQAAREDLTEDEKEILREKKRILVKIEEPIELYVGYADSGVLPAATLETLIMQNINLLLTL